MQDLIHIWKALLNRTSCSNPINPHFLTRHGFTSKSRKEIEAAANIDFSMWRGLEVITETKSRNRNLSWKFRVTLSSTMERISHDYHFASWMKYSAREKIIPINSPGFMWWGGKSFNYESGWLLFKKVCDKGRRRVVFLFRVCYKLITR